MVLSARQLCRDTQHVMATLNDTPSSELTIQNQKGSEGSTQGPAPSAPTGPTFLPRRRLPTTGPRSTHRGSEGPSALTQETRWPGVPGSGRGGRRRAAPMGVGHREGPPTQRGTRPRLTASLRSTSGHPREGGAPGHRDKRPQAEHPGPAGPKGTAEPRLERPNLRTVGNVTVIPSLGVIEGRETPGKAQTLSCLVSLPTRRSSLRRTP